MLIRASPANLTALGARAVLLAPEPSDRNSRCDDRLDGTFAGDDIGGTRLSFAGALKGNVIATSAHEVRIRRSEGRSSRAVNMNERLLVEGDQFALSGRNWVLQPERFPHASSDDYGAEPS